jgi:hypothetical protein
MTIAVHEYPFSSSVQKAKTASYKERKPLFALSHRHG